MMSDCGLWRAVQVKVIAFAEAQSHFRACYFHRTKRNSVELEYGVLSQE